MTAPTRLSGGAATTTRSPDNELSRFFIAGQRLWDVRKVRFREGAAQDGGTSDENDPKAKQKMQARKNGPDA